MIIRTWVLGTLSKINEMRVLLQGKQPAVFVANDKILAFE